MDVWLEKTRILEALKGHVQATDDPAEAAELKRYTEAFYRPAYPADLIATSTRRLAQIAQTCWEAAVLRPKGTPLIKVWNNDPDPTHGTPGRTMILLVNDDKPFLVDSVTAGLTSMGLDIHLIHHPTIRSWRDDAGKRLRTMSVEKDNEDLPTADIDGTVRESIIYIESERRGPKMRERIESELTEIISDVSAAVDDWHRMQGELHQAIQGLNANPPDVEPEELAETFAFLKWVADNNFILLGYREYGMDGDLTDPSFMPEMKHGLGVLRDPERLIWRGPDGFTVMSE
ncbi:MAG: hypothetical protein AAGF15_00675, partial [Pseudomonadota bacterium]